MMKIYHQKLIITSFKIIFVRPLLAPNQHSSSYSDAASLAYKQFPSKITTLSVWKHQPVGVISYTTQISYQEEVNGLTQIRSQV